MNTEVVDPAGIRGKKMFLPGEVSITTSWYSGEVSRSRSTQGKRGAENCIGLTRGEGQNIILSEIRMGALIFINWVTDSQENL
ncbi:MAG: hypothetical protein CMP13_09080 [Zunongwangia sp.]|uniref:Uncharacterized protein n=1 Tax=Zunongwangia profunda TaxID=398743 RepID=A0A3D5IUT9_9FLAO|nr:hypothetical protein [Zunongwangia sp.]HCV79635.1 hypothetical protein [Zunongwangia profunda]|tara:strand:+ start:123 stop:371 length:249 start_codon:yes stop_codon:yes gene_type:complete